MASLALLPESANDDDLFPSRALPPPSSALPAKYLIAQREKKSKMSEVNKLSFNEFRSDCLPVHVWLPAVAPIKFAGAGITITMANDSFSTLCSPSGGGGNGDDRSRGCKTNERKFIVESRASLLNEFLT